MTSKILIKSLADSDLFSDRCRTALSSRAADQKKKIF